MSEETEDPEHPSRAAKGLGDGDRTPSRVEILVAGRRALLEQNCKSVTLRSREQAETYGPYRNDWESEENVLGRWKEGNLRCRAWRARQSLPAVTWETRSVPDSPDSLAKEVSGGALSTVLPGFFWTL